MLLLKAANVIDLCQLRYKNNTLCKKKKVKSFVISENSRTFASHLEKCLFKSTLKRVLNKKNAEIAQLVEHNLAKVGVAGPSPVFRSSY